MKKLVRHSIFAFIFALAFFVCGAMSVKAAEPALNNTKIKGYDFSYNVEGNNYYALVGNKESAESSIVLASKQSGVFSGIAQYYTAEVAVVKCNEYDGASDACKTWSVWKYATGKDRATTTMDALKNEKAAKLVLDFNGLTPDQNATNVNGANLGELDSIYALEKTYFVIVQYTLNRFIAKDVTYNPDIFRVVFTDDLDKLQVTSKVENGETKVTIKSGFPINTVRYFKTNTALPAGYDYDTEYTKANNGVVALEEVADDPSAKNGVFTYTVKFTVTGQECYYVEATDIANAKITFDVKKGEHDQSPPVQTPNPGDPGNINDTNVGRIILIGLVVVLVLAVVLVIVQRIIDYRKKLY